MPVPDPEEVMELASELKQARSRIADLESRWAAFFAQREPNIVLVPVQNLKPRIVRFLEDKPEMAYTMADVSKALNANENSVGPYLSELAKDGKIEKRGRGLYGALRSHQEATNWVGESSDILQTQ